MTKEELKAEWSETIDLARGQYHGFTLEVTAAGQLGSIARARFETCGQLWKWEGISGFDTRLEAMAACEGAVDELRGLFAPAPVPPPLSEEELDV